MNTSYARPAMLLGVGYAGVVLMVRLGWLRTVDNSLSHPAHYGPPCWALNAAQATSLLLEGQLSLLYAGLLAVVCFVRGKHWPGILVVAFLISTVAVELVSKQAVFQPAPETMLSPRQDCSDATLALSAVSMPNSLPSGFAVRAAYFGVLLMGLGAAIRPGLATPTRWTVIPLSVLLGATRIVVAWHWMSDVLAGLLLGAAAAYGVLAFADGFNWLRPTAVVRQPSAASQPPRRK